MVNKQGIMSLQMNPYVRGKEIAYIVNRIAR
jgi:hypothetical protein